MFTGMEKGRITEKPYTPLEFSTFLLVYFYTNISIHILVENLFKKDPLQDLLSSLNAVISTNESTRMNYNRSCDL